MQGESPSIRRGFSPNISYIMGTVLLIYIRRNIPVIYDIRVAGTGLLTMLVTQGRLVRSTLVIPIFTIQAAVL